MHHISANYTLPTVMNTLIPAGRNASATSTSKAQAAASSSASGSASSTAADGGLGTTFLSLLSQELQNQDPTAPVDPTAMVGQMISLNQLEQLISINQGITSATTSTTATTGSGTATGGLQSSAVNNSAVMAPSGGLSSMLSPSTAGAATQQLPFDINTMMPLSLGNSAAVGASMNSSINAGTMGMSGTNNNAAGGK
jgi:flagellar basal-body rod modification protein FlgD